MTTPRPSPLPDGWPEESASAREGERLRALGVQPYPNRFERTHSLRAIAAAHGDKTLEELEALGRRSASPAGCCLKRPHGKASSRPSVATTGTCRSTSARTTSGEAAYRILDLVDRGDFIGVAGRVMRTRKGELSVQAGELPFLAKALLPPPEKWHGLADVEIRYRQRYVDLMRQPRGAADLPGAQRHGERDAPLPGRARLRRGRDADDAAHRRRRAGAALRDPPQRPGHGPLPAHRAGAVPEAAGGGRPGAGLRDQPELPERGDLVDAQPRVHHAGVLHRVLRLPRRHGHHRGAARRRGAPDVSRGLGGLQGTRGLVSRRPSRGCA